MHNFFPCEGIIPHLLLLVIIIDSQRELSSLDWSAQWTQIFDVFSVLHGNDDICGIFTMFNSNYASQGIDRPTMFPGEQVYHVYQPQLLRCFLEKDIFFCCSKCKPSNFLHDKNIPLGTNNDRRSAGVKICF